MLAQQDFQDIAALLFADQRRGNDTQAANQAMGNPEMFHWFLR